MAKFTKANNPSKAKAKSKGSSVAPAAAKKKKLPPWLAKKLGK